MLRTWSAALRPSRAEILSVAIAAIAILAVLGGLLAFLNSLNLPTICFSVESETEPLCRTRASAIRTYLEAAGAVGGVSFIVLAVAAPVAGVLLGLALMGKDLDQRTTEFAWSLAPSRRRWLATRVAPTLLGILLLAGATGFLADLVEGMQQRTINPQRSLEHFGFRGVVIAGLTIMGFGMSLLVNAIIGRLLLALLLASLVVGCTMLGVTLVNDGVLQTNTVVVPFDDDIGPGRRIGFLIRTPDGEVITYDDAYVRYGSLAVDNLDPDLGLTQMVVLVPGDVYPLASWRLAVIYAAIGAAAMTFAFAVIERRRP